MEMGILDFIEQQYPIKDIVSVRLSDPVKAVMEQDSLPYDKIALDENGNFTKMVEITEERCIPVVELISYTKEEIDKTNDDNLRDAYNAYMSLIDVQDIEIADIIASARKYDNIRKKREEQLAKCT